MSAILILGSGKSAWFCINYLHENIVSLGITITVADASNDNLKAVKSDFPNIHTIVLNATDQEALAENILGKVLVISLLPAIMHYSVAKICLHIGVNLLTPSYLNDDLKSLNEEVFDKNLCFLNEMGLDPGIDHISALSLIDHLNENGHSIYSFESYCGGLIPKDLKPNPFRYKLSWNPYNVVRAGKDGAVCRIDKHTRFYPYHKLFGSGEFLDIGGEHFEVYNNRNSLPYLDLYHLPNVSTFVRGTLRYPPFCEAWHCLVSSGLTNDYQKIRVKQNSTWADFTSELLGVAKENLVDTLMQNSPRKSKEGRAALQFLVESVVFLDFDLASPAEALQFMLETEWKLNDDESDRIILIHKIKYTDKAGLKYLLTSVLDLTGEDYHKTAMAKTVGLPLALAAEMMILNLITEKGVIMPNHKSIYKPILERLNAMGINFTDTVSTILV
ncbi:MAG: saccharopine dehydrogenase C-terminal domain-containing protein [Bacteroidota bacterium]|nr:saccharopine dehydrogenase C-terminal domain-containing protein [Bacteroidota bacterium]